MSKSTTKSEGVVAVSLKTQESADGAIMVQGGQLVHVLESILGDGRFRAEVLFEKQGELTVVGVGEFEAEFFDFVGLSKQQKKLTKKFLDKRKKLHKKETQDQKKKKGRPSRRQRSTSTTSGQPPALATSSGNPPEDPAGQKKSTRLSSVVDKLRQSGHRMKKLSRRSFVASRGPKTAGPVLFGVPLDKVMTPAAPPLFLVKAAEAVSAQLAEEGIFRISGAASALVENKTILEELERERIRRYVKCYGKHASIPPSDICPIDFTKLSVHTVTGLIKLFFRDLPDPLLPTTLYQEFLGLINIPDHNERVNAASALFRALPPCSLTMFNYLAEIATKVASVPQNKMGFSNLAIVFGPTLLQAPDATFSVDQIAVVTFLFQYHSQIIGNNLNSGVGITTLNLSEEDLPSENELYSETSESDMSESDSNEPMLVVTTTAKDVAPPPRPPRRPRSASSSSFSTSSELSSPSDDRQSISALKKIATFGINMDELKHRLRRRGETDEEREERLRDEENRVKAMIEEEQKQMAEVAVEIEVQASKSPVIRRMMSPEPIANRAAPSVNTNPLKADVVAPADHPAFVPVLPNLPAARENTPLLGASASSLPTVPVDASNSPRHQVLTHPTTDHLHDLNPVIDSPPVADNSSSGCCQSCNIL